MNSAFCTIITQDYIHYALALRKSVLDTGADIDFYILVSDGNGKKSNDFQEKYPGAFILSIDEVCNDGIGKAIYNKYHHTDMSAFRWSMKPVLINYLLQKKGLQKVIYSDADIYFYSDYNFLLEDLDNYHVLISPHWRSSDPQKELSNFEILFTSGIYNGGFIAGNRNAVPAMEWWARACEFICIKDPSRGMFGDQTHLNLLPVYFDHVGIVKHRGCNVANWNMVECSRTITANNAVIIDDKYPVVFIHFTESTINGIVSGVDGLLLPYLEKYYESINYYAKEFGFPGITLSLPKREQPLPGTSTGIVRIKNMLKRSIK